jgi:hypothetical protein
MRNCQSTALRRSLSGCVCARARSHSEIMCAAQSKRSTCPGSWDGPQVICAPQSSHYKPYPASQMRYEDGTLRAFNILIETSDAKASVDRSLLVKRVVNILV